jgi:osmotically-inducible protein OsmY
MFGGNDVSDKELLKTVKRRLERTGTASQNRLTATVQRGTVTLVGKLQYDNQRVPILKAASSVPGVRHVVDQLQSPPKVRPHGA